MKNLLNICILLFLSVLAIGMYHAGYRKGEKKVTSTALESVDIENVQELTKEYMLEVQQSNIYPIIDRIIKAEFLPDNQLQLTCTSEYMFNVETNKQTENKYYPILTFNYDNDTKCINDILDNHLDMTLTLNTRLDIDSNLLLTYCGFTSGEACIMKSDKIKLSSGYLFTFKIYIYSNNYCYEYMLGYIDTSILNGSALESVITTILETGAYEDKDVIFLQNSTRAYLLADNTYILNY